MDEWKLVSSALRRKRRSRVARPRDGRGELRVEEVEANKAPRFYFDLQKHKEFFDNGVPPRRAGFGAFALDVAVDLYEGKGRRNIWARRACSPTRFSRIEALACTLLSDSVRSVIVTGMRRRTASTTKGATELLDGVAS